MARRSCPSCRTWPSTALRRPPIWAVATRNFAKNAMPASAPDEPKAISTTALNLTVRLIGSPSPQFSIGKRQQAGRIETRKSA